MNYESGSVRCSPKDDIDSKAVKQIVTGHYNYALNALYSKPEIKETIIKKVAHEVALECEKLCSLSSASILRDASPNGLKVAPYSYGTVKYRSELEISE